MLTLVDVLTRTERFLRERGIDSPRLEAELLLCHVLDMKRLDLYLSHDRPCSPDELGRLRPLVSRRGRREPLAYILGNAHFHAIELQIRPGVLVPRPDTETLVEAALGWFGEPEGPVYVADVGCGSGAVGLSLATAHSMLRVYCTDLSDAALDTTRDNVTRLGLDKRVAVLRGDLLSPIPPSRTIDWVVSNPPYIARRVIPTLMPEVSMFEPREALDGGLDGLDVYRRLIPLAADRARCGLLVEIGHDQAAEVSDLFRRAGLVDITTWKDLPGHIRVVGGRTPPR